MARQDGEITGFKHVEEDSHSRVDCQVLPVIGAIFLFRRAELSGADEGIPDALHSLLEDSAHGGS
jgi:hypothetical protein